jgi:hypothetical protein
MLIGMNLNNPMEDSQCFGSSICGNSEDVIATLLSTPFFSTAWRLQQRDV